MHNFDYHLSLFTDVYIYKIVKSLDHRGTTFSTLLEFLSCKDVY
jgi:hypothetical protein